MLHADGPYFRLLSSASGGKAGQMTAGWNMCPITKMQRWRYRGVDWYSLGYSYLDWCSWTFEWPCSIHQGCAWFCDKHRLVAILARAPVCRFYWWQPLFVYFISSSSLSAWSSKRWRPPPHLRWAGRCLPEPKLMSLHQRNQGGQDSPWSWIHSFSHVSPKAVLEMVHIWRISVDWSRQFDSRCTLDLLYYCLFNLALHELPRSRDRSWVSFRDADGQAARRF